MRKIIVLCLILLLLTGCQKKERTARDYTDINRLGFSEMKRLDVDLHSHAYLLVRLNDFKVLYGKNDEEEIYPASLTKLVTLDTCLSTFDDYEETSSFTDLQYWDLILQNASVAYLHTNREYTLNDLFYALILPSGADAAVALENHFEQCGLNIVEQMNAASARLELTDSHFINTTGLHEEDHYTSLRDLLKVILDILQYDQGKEVLETLRYSLEDGTTVKSTLTPLQNMSGELLGGKTGFTGEAGQNVAVLFRKGNRSYLLLLCGAMGNPYNGESFHFDDAETIASLLPSVEE